MNERTSLGESSTVARDPKGKQATHESSVP